MNVKYSVPIIRWWPWTECRTAPVVKVIGLVLGIWTSVGFFNVLNPKNLHKCLLKQCWSQTLFPLFDFASKYIFSICSFRVCVNENLLYHMLREILNYQMPFFKAAFFPQMENCAWKSFHTLFFFSWTYLLYLELYGSGLLLIIIGIVGLNSACLHNMTLWWWTHKRLSWVEEVKGWGKLCQN